ncbi:hypothetical protein ACPDHJ_12725 [Myroides sp. C8-3]|uniref:hypothetical protein n=1 Tax=Myroides sp. C8-3 TaxID=3400533 RepID=UPI003D2F5894
MEQYNKHSFFVEVGVTIPSGKEVNKLQVRFGFSEEMRKLLLVQSQGNTRHSLMQSGITSESLEALEGVVVWYTLDSLDETLDIIERNEDCVLSDYLFVFAQDHLGNQYAEITKGKWKGHIVWLNALYYADVDSLEELLEEYSDSAEASIGRVEDETVFQLLYTSQQLVAMQASSLEMFLC